MDGCHQWWVRTLSPVMPFWYACADTCTFHAIPNMITGLVMYVASGKQKEQEFFKKKKKRKNQD
jgi:hypothetical protein